MVKGSTLMESWCNWLPNGLLDRSASTVLRWLLKQRFLVVEGLTACRKVFLLPSPCPCQIPSPSVHVELVIQLP